MSIIRLKTAATVEPVSTADAKAHCQVPSSFTADDAIFAAFVKAARRQGEQQTGAAFVESTWEQIMPGFPRGGQPIELLRHPVISVTNVAYVDTDGAAQVLTATTDYNLIIEGGPGMGKIHLAYDQDWPDTREQPDAVTVTFKAGWALTGGPPATTVTTPEDILTWIKIRVAELYAQREGFVLGQAVGQLPRHFCDALLDPWRVFRGI